MSQSQPSNTVGRSNRIAKFRQADVTRAVKAAKKAKLTIAGVRIEPDGTIVIIHGAPQPVSPPHQRPMRGMTSHMTSVKLPYVNVERDRHSNPIYWYFRRN